MRNILKITAFMLIIIGTAGLLLNQFAWGHSSALTILFAVLNTMGLVDLAYTSFGKGHS